MTKEPIVLPLGCLQGGVKEGGAQHTPGGPRVKLGGQFWLRVSGSGSGLGVWSLGFRVQGTGLRVESSEFKVECLWLRACN